MGMPDMNLYDVTVTETVTYQRTYTLHAKSAEEAEALILADARVNGVLVEEEETSYKVEGVISSIML